MCGSGSSYNSAMDPTSASCPTAARRQASYPAPAKNSEYDGWKSLISTTSDDRSKSASPSHAPSMAACHRGSVRKNRHRSRW
ncbi:unnamed protein product [Gemmataceae bacterium]|nr:unnamed protein product [Gemmataceae bacterium]VTT99812.1 unnamed protein product [Gemmataceae bacterium]